MSQPQSPSSDKELYWKTIKERIAKTDEQQKRLARSRELLEELDGLKLPIAITGYGGYVILSSYGSRPDFYE